ncbi:hypothetical protein IWW36_004304 [Coemansia brasiliensis]|uniref:Uncharacterized protein n=1 Tax=Coemansia brasiliensis TaxID=2650707 RepID=A0A9W8ICF1_9FUNG|nr:hypothetical protein IWW36_004304 [Coemansia brasiliensis]
MASSDNNIDEILDSLSSDTMPQYPHSHRNSSSEPQTSGLKRTHSEALTESTNFSCGAMNYEQCVADMVSQRNELRKRFKKWTNDVEQAATQLREVTDNALVSQSIRLEKILSDGKAKVETIVNDQNRIRSQLASFMSMLSSAQTQIFGENSYGVADSDLPSAGGQSIRPIPKYSAEKHSVNT